MTNRPNRLYRAVAAFFAIALTVLTMAAPLRGLGGVGRLLTDALSATAPADASAPVEDDELPIESELESESDRDVENLTCVEPWFDLGSPEAVEVLSTAYLFRASAGFQRASTPPPRA